jgi:hypothetical protein
MLSAGYLVQVRAAVAAEERNVCRWRACSRRSARSAAPAIARRGLRRSCLLCALYDSGRPGSPSRLFLHEPVRLLVSPQERSGLQAVVEHCGAADRAVLRRVASGLAAHLTIGSHVATRQAGARYYSRHVGGAIHAPGLKPYLECDGCLLLGDDADLREIATTWRHPASPFGAPSPISQRITSAETARP